MHLDTLHTAAQIEAGLQTGRLERARQAREATLAAPRHSRLRRQVGTLLSQAGAWLHDMPAGTFAAERSPATPSQTPV